MNGAIILFGNSRSGVTIWQMISSRRSACAAIVKGAISQLPVLGSIITELITQAIPDRRIERLTGLSERLEQRVADLEPVTTRDRSVPRSMPSF